jgi:hypothetical protein
MSDIRYPIGKFEPKSPLTGAGREAMIGQIAEAPARLREAVRGLSEAQIDVPYREGGWTTRQIVHHLPDSHMNAYVRCKLAVTEQQPTIKPYVQPLWAELADARSAPVEVSLTLLEALHERWAIFLRSLRGDDFSRTMIHPEIGTISLDYILQMYAWHGRHHTAHITSLRERLGWR